MKKNLLWGVVGVVVVILAIYLIVSMPGDEAGAPSQTPNGQANVPAANEQGEPATAVNPLENRTPEPIETPIFMTDEEKESLNIDKNTKVQVLQRFEDGTIGAYKVINNDSDVLTSF